MYRQVYRELDSDGAPATTFAESAYYDKGVLAVRRKVWALLSPACRGHPNILSLTRLVLDSLHNPVQLLFELAEFGDLGK
jgi:hypothetical protein